MAKIQPQALGSISIQGLAGSGSGTGLTNIYTASMPYNGSSGILNDLLAEQAFGPHIKKYQVIEITEDLLALSSAWYRMREAYANGAPHTNITKLLDELLFKYVTSADHDMASNIRDYYSKKIMMWKLKGQQLSKFREDMNTFIHGDGKIFKEDFCPLVYRLPEFYAYDVEFDLLTNEHNKLISTKINGSVANMQLTLRKTFIVGKRHSKRKEYWFTNQNDNLVTMSFQHDNPLISLLDVYAKNSFSLSGLFYTYDRDNVQYLKTQRFTFL